MKIRSLGNIKHGDKLVGWFCDTALIGFNLIDHLLHWAVHIHVAACICILSIVYLSLPYKINGDHVRFCLNWTMAWPSWSRILFINYARVENRASFVFIVLLLIFWLLHVKFYFIIFYLFNVIASLFLKVGF